MKMLLCVVISVLLMTSTTAVAFASDGRLTLECVIYEFDSKSQTYTIVGRDIPEDVSELLTLSGYKVKGTPSYSVDGVELYGTGSEIDIYFRSF